MSSAISSVEIKSIELVTTIKIRRPVSRMGMGANTNTMADELQAGKDPRRREDTKTHSCKDKM